MYHKKFWIPLHNKLQKETDSVEQKWHFQGQNRLESTIYKSSKTFAHCSTSLSITAYLYADIL